MIHHIIIFILKMYKKTILYNLYVLNKHKVVYFNDSSYFISMQKKNNILHVCYRRVFTIILLLANNKYYIISRGEDNLQYNSYHLKFKYKPNKLIVVYFEYISILKKQIWLKFCI